MKHFAIAVALGLAVAGGFADVTLPRIFSDSMVLQQSREVAIWGWAAPNEAITIDPSWPTPDVSTTADADGRFVARIWTPEAGGPFTLTVRGENAVVLKDVMIGEVWLASGQSNMEWPLSAIGPGRAGVPSAQEEIALADHPNIRMFRVENTMAPEPRIDCKGTWAPVTPATAAAESAVGYFFARELQKRTGVPIGIIDATWGGTPAESWISRDSLASFPEFSDAIATLDAIRDPNLRSGLAEQAALRWWSALDRRGPNPIGADWATRAADDTWQPCTLPGGFDGPELPAFDGVVYFRKTVVVPEGVSLDGAVLELGAIDDRDETFVNGRLVGGTRDDGKWNQARKYSVASGVLKPGENTIAVRVLDTAGLGGFGGPAEAMKLVLSNGKTINLAGD